MRRRVRMLRCVAAMVAVFALAGCFPRAGGGPSTASGSGPTATTPGRNLAGYYAQNINWQGCGSGFSCATIQVPMNWAQPEAAAISIALVKHPATGKKLGSLLLNPGGPGASGVDLVQQSMNMAVAPALSVSYDLIGFDPRGSQRSNPVTCYTAAQLDAYHYGIPKAQRGTDAWVQEQEASAKAFGAACANQTGPLLGYVDTASAARDMDVIRQAVGDAKLNYLGYSYGTLLGATYAGLYPDKVGRMVLDGAIDPTITSVDMSAAQAAGFEVAMRAYLADCLAKKGCPFTGSVDDAMATVSKLLAAVDAKPVEANDGRSVGADTLLIAIIFPLYTKSSWSALTAMFTQFRTGNPTIALAFADQYYDRTSSGTYDSNAYEAFAAVNCLDYDSQSDLATMRQRNAVIQKAAPTFGTYMSWSDIPCNVWPYKQVTKREPITAAGAPPIVVVGTTRDPATPYAWAVALAKQLSSGVLVTRDGDGHTGYNKGNACVDNAVNQYLLANTVPAKNTQC